MGGTLNLPGDTGGEAACRVLRLPVKFTEPPRDIARAMTKRARDVSHLLSTRTPPGLRDSVPSVGVSTHQLDKRDPHAAPSAPSRVSDFVPVTDSKVSFRDQRIRSFCLFVFLKKHIWPQQLVSLPPVMSLTWRVLEQIPNLN